MCSACRGLVTFHLPPVRSCSSTAADRSAARRRGSSPGWIGGGDLRS
jgi:hypothetical protein